MSIIKIINNKNMTSSRAACSSPRTRTRTRCTRSPTSARCCPSRSSAGWAGLRRRSPTRATTWPGPTTQRASPFTSSPEFWRQPGEMMTTLTESLPLSLSPPQFTHTDLSIVCSFGRLDPKTCMIETFHNNSKVITKFYKCQNWLSERAFKLDFELNICT